MAKRRKKVWVSDYSRKKNTVPGHWRTLNEGVDWGQVFSGQQRPAVNVMVETSPDTRKAFIFGLGGLALGMVASALIGRR